ncbi:MAG: SURF1 family protein [Acidimicrobiales bacterium]|jgi:cytochrome oxidase assembly protein ShyY1|nr:SURF1 family protein [Acidimicrobiales bacterium]
MYSFVREPKWIVAHILALILLIAFVFAGVWQLGRHQNRIDRNDAVVDRENAAMLRDKDLFEPDDVIEFRIAKLNGVWSSDDVVLIRNRSHQDVAGCHLAVPLAISESRGVLVVAGWLHEASCTVEDFVPPAGEVSVTGRVRLSQSRGAMGARDRPDGVIATLARTDVARVDQQVSLSLAPVYVELISSNPPVADAIAVDRPPTDLGPHLAYAVQWFLFFAVGAVGYPLVLRRQAHKGNLEDLRDSA